MESYCPIKGTSPAKILVVDDHEQVRGLIVRWLQEDGHETFQAESVEQAEQILSTQAVDIVTSDIKMPGRSGSDWAPKLSQHSPELGILMISACEDTRLAIRTLTQGAWGYLIKPIAKEELKFQIGRTIERRNFLIAEKEMTQRLKATVRRQTQMLQESHQETIERLISASMVRDDETGEHIRRIGVLSAIVAEAMGWSMTDVDSLRLASPMHDIGKVGIPDAILRKPGPLSREEYEVMKTHTTIGAQILANSNLPMIQMAETIALCHHERWDGSGYPNGLKDLEIPLPARIVAVVDVFDALTHDRVYRSALPVDIAVHEIVSGVGTHFDPEVVEAFRDCYPRIKDEVASEGLQQSHVYPTEALQ